MEPYDTTQGELLTEAEVRRLTSVFLLLALEMAEPPETCEHAWRWDVAPLDGFTRTCVSCGVRA